jgi:hypothetical protein
MAGSCRIACEVFCGDGQWRRDGDTLILSPAAAPPLGLALGEIRGISGDGFSLILQAPAGPVELSKMGADGVSLLRILRRDWLLLRAKTLRLCGNEKPPLFCGHAAVPDATCPFNGMVVDDRLILAPEGGDLACIFLCDFQSVQFDQAAYAVTGSGWNGQTWRFSRLGGATAAFAAALQQARDGLAVAAEQTMARYLPTLTAAGRAQLARQWLPGRMMTFATLERLAPGFVAAFEQSWLAAGPRRDSGKVLMQGADCWLGYRPADNGEPPWLWLLARHDQSWSLEQLAYQDYATYRFQAGDELPGLVETVVRLPEFSREALYQPLAGLVADQAGYAIAARDFAMLRELRARFAERKIHAPAA